MALFNRSLRPNNTIEGWGTITRYGLFVHGVRSNPFVGPATYICHSGIDSDEQYSSMVGDYQVWMVDQAQCLASSNQSVLSQTFQINDILKHVENGLKPSDMERSMSHPGSICSSNSKRFNVTSTEHTKDNINLLNRPATASDRKPRKFKKSKKNTPTKTNLTSRQKITTKVQDVISEKVSPVLVKTKTPQNLKRKNKELFFLPEDQGEAKVNIHQDESILQGLYSSKSPKNADRTKIDSLKHKKPDFPIISQDGENYEIEPEPECFSEPERKNINIPSIKASIDSLEKELMESLVTLKIHKGEQGKGAGGNKQLDDAIKDAKRAAMTCDMAEKLLQRSNLRKEKEDVIGVLLQESLESYRNLIRDKNAAENLRLDVQLDSPRLGKNMKPIRSLKKKLQRKNSKSCDSKTYPKKKSPKSRNRDKNTIMKEIERLNEELNEFRPNKSCFSVHSQSSFLADNESETDTDWSSIIEESKSVDESVQSLKASIRKCSLGMKRENHKPRNSVVNAVREIMAELV